jgi:hypothetical protein
LFWCCVGEGFPLTATSRAGFRPGVQKGGVYLKDHRAQSPVCGFKKFIEELKVKSESHCTCESESRVPLHVRVRVPLHVRVRVPSPTARASPSPESHCTCESESHCTCAESHCTCESESRVPLHAAPHDRPGASPHGRRKPGRLVLGVCSRCSRLLRWFYTNQAKEKRAPSFLFAISRTPKRPQTPNRPFSWFGFELKPPFLSPTFCPLSQGFLTKNTKAQKTGVNRNDKGRPVSARARGHANSAFRPSSSSRKSPGPS